MIFKVIGSMVGVFIFFSILYFQGSEYTKTRSRNPAQGLKDREFYFNDLQKINQTKDVPHKNSASRVAIVLSPTCPHCKRILKILSGEFQTPDSINLIAVMKDQNNKQEIQKMLNEEKITFPVQLIKENDIMREIKAVPTFILLDKQNIVKYSITGGARNSMELSQLLLTLINFNPWRPTTKEELQKGATCVH